jgi:outer membrane protein
MRQVVRSALVGLTLLVGAAGAAQAQRVAYVNTQAVLQYTPARESAEAEFNRRMAPLQAEMARMDSTWRTMLTTFQRDSMSATPQRETAAQQLQQRQQQFQQRMQQIEDSAGTLRASLMQPIMQRLERALEDARREGNFALIFDVAQGANIVAADTTLDVTRTVITKMGGTPPAAGTRPTAAAPGAAPAAPAAGPVAAPAGVTRRPPSRR